MALGLAASRRLRVSVHKFTSCDGCQLSLLDCEEELLTMAEVTEISYFAEASSSLLPGPYDVALVEGSISTPEEARRSQDVRAAAALFVSVGACATVGGIQALRNGRDIEAMKRITYPRTALVRTLPASTPHSVHVKVDLEIPGCPPSKDQILEVVTRLLLRQRPRLPSHSLCLECKRRGNVCVLVSGGQPCLGPITHAGCGALCPSYGRACYGCFGPMDDPQPGRLARELEKRGLPPEEIVRRLQEITAGDESLTEVAERYKGGRQDP
jgi:coenzyme F420-reducing hydrogenase gamma subunit